VDTNKHADKPASFYQSFDVVFVNGVSFEEQARINAACRLSKDTKFFAAETCGWFCYYHSDLQVVCVCVCVCVCVQVCVFVCVCVCVFVRVWMVLLLPLRLAGLSHHMAQRIPKHGRRSLV
jgi:hypothetical protein